jgi:hypothetical protein
VGRLCGGRYGGHPARVASEASQEDTLRLGLLIVFPVIGLEQLLHTSPGALQALPLYETLHWLSDGLLALPLAVAAVWSGRWVGDRLRLGRSGKSNLFARACVIAVLFAMLLVPGAALHDQADMLTHAHALLAVNTHTPDDTRPTDGPLVVASTVAHALTDGLQGQAIGLPLLFAALLWSTRTRGRGGVRNTAHAVPGSEDQT